MRSLLQRLFSTFANGWPGKGLAIMRLGISAFLAHGFIAALGAAASISLSWLAMLAAGAGVFLLLGLWTPAAGSLAALIELWIAYSRPLQFWESMLAAAIASGLALVGPGAWSIDAHSYGRKRISIRDR